MEDLSKDINEQDVNKNRTGWKNEPQLRELISDYNKAKSAQSSYISNIEKWKDIKNNLGFYKQEKKTNKSAFNSKLSRKFTEWRYPSLSEPFLKEEELFKLSAINNPDIAYTEQAQAIINYQFNNLINKVDFIDEFVRRNVDEGICIVKTSWHREYTTVAEKQLPIYSYVELDPDSEQALALQEAINLYAENTSEFLLLNDEVKEAVEYYLEKGVLTQVTLESYKVEKNYKEISVNKPTLEIINPKNFWIDPSCKRDINKAKFAVVAFESCLGELQATGLYTNLDKIMTSNGILNDDNIHIVENTFNFEDDTRKRLTVYEYWGKYDIYGNGSLISIVCTWVGSTIIRLEESPFPGNKLPFVISTYIPNFDTFFGDSDIELLEDSQVLAGAVTRGIIETIGKTALTQKGVRKGFVDEVNKQKLITGQDFEFNVNSNPAVDIYENRPSEVSQTMLTFLSAQFQEAESLTGLKTYIDGISGNSLGTVAAGIKGVLSATSDRTTSILRRLSNSIIEIGKNLMLLNAEFLTDKEVIKISDKQFIKIDKEKLKQGYDFKITIESSEVNAQKFQELSFLLQTSVNTLPLDVTMSIWIQIAKLLNLPVLVKKLEDMANKPPSEEEQIQKQIAIKKAQLELAMLEAQLSEINSKIKLNEAKAIESQAKSEREYLEIDEEVAGINHARQLELMEAQARSNRDNVITKGLVDNKDSTNDDNIVKAIGFNEMVKGN